MSLQIPEVGSNVKMEGGNSKCIYRFDLIPPEVLFAVASIFKYGADKYAPDGWKAYDYKSHLNHALQHIFAYLANDDSDAHLEHAITRLIMALYASPEYVKVQEYDKETKESIIKEIIPKIKTNKFKRAKHYEEDFPYESED